MIKQLFMALCLFFSLLGMTAAGAEPPTTLRQAAAGHFLIGTAVSPAQLADSATGPLVAAQFDCLTAEDAFKPASLEPERGRFTFADADRITAFAAAHHMALVGHNLCWHQQSPPWLYARPDGTPLPRKEALDNLHGYIRTVVAHFKGKILGWDVVNEAIDDGPGYLRDSPAHRAIGDDFVEKAFAFAHEADPQAELYYNDYGIESPGKREKAVRLIHDLKAHGLRVDAVSIQGHCGLNWPLVSAFEEAIRAFQAEGVKVCISELDVDVLPRRTRTADVGARETGADPYKDGIPEAALQAQADRYAALFGVFARHPKEIERVTFWGVDDCHSWLNNFPVRGRTNYPLLFSRGMQPKPAFAAIVRVLENKTGEAKTAEAADHAEMTIGPAYADAPELTVEDGVPRGTVHEFTMNSTDSKIYPGIAKNQPGTVPYQRRVAVYVPQQYVPGTPAPLLVVQDGLGYRSTVAPILDTLIHQRRLPALVAVFVNSGGGDAQGSERGLEYDTLSDAYARFIESEVLPRITADYHVTFTRDPEGRATMGGSSGGAAAFTMAWFRPDLYRRVLTYSGTYVNQQSPPNPASPHGAWEYHEHWIAQNPRKPLRVWLEVGERDNGANRDEASLHNWVLANQRMAAALKAKGYPYRYLFAAGAGHVDGRVTRQTLPGALEWLWQSYPVR